MKIGLMVVPTDTSLDPAILAKRAEDVGFESFFVPEHVFIPVHTASPAYRRDASEGIPDFYAHIVDPFMALARASAVTNTIKLGTGICLVPEHNPLLLAKEVATLDRLSGGRFIFGVGAGWLKEETELLGGDFLHRWTQTKDAVLAMKELWSKEEPEYHGRYYDFPPVRSNPKPIQKPHPPIFLGGSAKNVFKRVVEWATAGCQLFHLWKNWSKAGPSLTNWRTKREETHLVSRSTPLVVPASSVIGMPSKTWSAREPTG